MAQTEWEDVKSTARKFDQLELPTGETTIRCLETKPYFFHDHWFDIPGGTRRVFCCGVDEGCLACKDGLLPGKRYYIPVWDYKSKTPKVLEAGVSIFNYLRKFFQDSERGDLTKYDVKIDRVGTGLKTEYTVLPGAKQSDLTKEQIAGLETLRALDLNTYAEPTPLNDMKVLLNMRKTGEGESPTPSSSETGPGDDFFRS
jgi:hypothetical protein